MRRGGGGSGSPHSCTRGSCCGAGTRPRSTANSSLRPAPQPKPPLTDDAGKAMPVAVPSLATLHRAIRRDLNPGQRAALAGGERARRGHDVHLRRPRQWRNACWEGDHKHVPVEVDLHGELVCPWVTWFIDCATNAVTGVAIDTRGTAPVVPLPRPGRVAAAAPSGPAACGVRPSSERPAAAGRRAGGRAGPRPAVVADRGGAGGRFLGARGPECLAASAAGLDRPCPLQPGPLPRGLGPAQPVESASGGPSSYPAAPGRGSGQPRARHPPHPSPLPHGVGADPAPATPRRQSRLRRPAHQVHHLHHCPARPVTTRHCPRTRPPSRWRPLH